ncbi:hypothetical protein NL676_002944 [Syzygium grande]|nr:hypothetical protein NL676_002944 [Syzygium grande]
MSLRAQICAWHVASPKSPSIVFAGSRTPPPQLLPPEPMGGYNSRARRRRAIGSWGIPCRLARRSHLQPIMVLAGRTLRAALTPPSWTLPGARAVI